MEAIVNHCCGPCQEIKYNVQVQEESQLLALNGIYIIIVGEIFYTIYAKLFWTIIRVYPAFQTRSLFNSIFPPLLSLIRWLISSQENIEAILKILNPFFYAENVTHFTMPVIGTMRTSEVAGHPYFPLVESPGILYLIQSNKDLQSTVSNAILSSISESWPIMVFVYLAAAVSGIIVWALVSNKTIRFSLIPYNLFVCRVTQVLRQNVR